MRILDEEESIKCGIKYSESKKDTCQFKFEHKHVSNRAETRFEFYHEHEKTERTIFLKNIFLSDMF